MSCYDNLTGGFTKNCDRPIKSGLRSKGVGMNVDDISEWILSGNSNQYLPVLKAGKTTFPIEALGQVPYTGTNVASAVDDFSRNFTKTLVFNIPESGSAAALKVEQLTKSEKGFVFIVEGKDAGGDLNGNFIIFGKDEPLLCTVAKDYVAGVSAPVITATSTESGYENFLFHTDLTTTKTTFDTLYAGDLTKRLYHLEWVITPEVAAMVKITLLFGTAPVTTGYKLVCSAALTAGGSTMNAVTPSVPQLSGSVEVDPGITIGDEPYFANAVLVETAAETAGNQIYFVASAFRDVSTLTTG